MLHSIPPWETETGSAGEQPVKGYQGQAHQTMRVNERGMVFNWCHAPLTEHRMIDLPCLRKRKRVYCKPVYKEPGPIQ